MGGDGGVGEVIDEISIREVDEEAKLVFLGVVEGE